MSEITVQLTAWLLGLIAASTWELAEWRPDPWWAARLRAFAIDDVIDQAGQAAALARWE